MIKSQPALIVLCLILYFLDVLIVGYFRNHLAESDEFSIIFWDFILAAIFHFPLFFALTWKMWKKAPSDSKSQKQTYTPSTLQKQEQKKTTPTPKY